jgi:hypothetical protein
MMIHQAAEPCPLYDGNIPAGSKAYIYIEREREREREGDIMKILSPGPCNCVVIR